MKDQLQEINYSKKNTPKKHNMESFSQFSAKKFDHANSPFRGSNMQILEHPAPFDNRQMSSSNFMLGSGTSSHQNLMSQSFNNQQPFQPMAKDRNHSRR